MTLEVESLMASIHAGEDTELELKELIFKGNRIALGGSETRPAARLAQVLVSMANTSGGHIVLGVRDGDRKPVGIDPGKRELVEGLVVNAASQNCIPMIVPRLDWEFLPDEDGEPKLCLIVEVPVSRFEVHQTSDGRYLQRIGSHQRLIPAEQLAGFLRNYKSPVTGSSYMEARGEGFLNLVRASERISGRRPDLEQIGEATKLTIFAATHESH